MSLGNRQQGRSLPRPSQQQQRPQQRGPQARQQQPPSAGDKPLSPAAAEMIEKEVEFTPFMGKEVIKLSVGIVRQFVATPTKNGCHPTDRDIVKFIMLCKACGLNPFEGDAYLVGYDNRDAPPTFSLITAHVAFLKRAEVHCEYEGMESGVIVLDVDKNVVRRTGSFFLESDSLVGGWAIVYKKGKKPTEKTVRLKTFNTGFARWKADPEGMIAKVAEAHALRSAFPSTFGGMYLEGEIDDEALLGGSEEPAQQGKQPAGNLDQLTNRLLGHQPLGPAFPQTAQHPKRQPVPAARTQQSSAAPREPEYGAAPEAGYQDYEAIQDSDEPHSPEDTEQYLRDRFAAAATSEEVDRIVLELKGPEATEDWSEWSDDIEIMAQEALKRIYEAMRDQSADDWPDRQRFLEKLAERNSVSGVDSLQKAFVETNPEHRTEIESACEARKSQIVDSRTDQAKANQGSLLQ